MLSDTEILQAVDQGEAQDWEFKSAKGGIPKSMYETYSAMANSKGGVIVLGVEQKEETFWISGLPSTDPARKVIWDTLNNRGKVSVNLLSDDDLTVRTINGRAVIVLRVPKASRRSRPVYLDQNPLGGTYRRNHEGDYRCSPDEVGRMLADQTEETPDSRILEHFGLGDLDLPSFAQYRQRFASRSPDHPWLALGDQELLTKLGGWRMDRRTGMEGLTVAGLMMFGKEEAIRDEAAVPQYHVDYREKMSDDPSVRWTDRLHPNGLWVANLYQFYQQVILRATRELKIPFQLRDMERVDDTPVHEALREALTNAIIHADYRGQGGIVIRRFRRGFEMSNPGSLLLSIAQLRAGGVSECRNKSLQLMFQMMGRGEKAGTGIDTIIQGWNSEHWRSPDITETVGPDRVILRLPMISLLPEDSLQRLRTRFGAKFNTLRPIEVQALVTAEVEGVVSNARMQLVSDDHPVELTKAFQHLVAEGCLSSEGHGPRTSYKLPPAPEERAAIGTNSSTRSEELSTSSPNSSVESEELGEEEVKALRALAYPEGFSKALPRQTMRNAIRRVCSGHFRTAAQLGLILGRNPIGLRNDYLSAMAREGELELLDPQDRNNPNQAYRTAESTAQDGEALRLG